MNNKAMHMNSNDRRKLAISEIILICVGVVGLGVLLWIAWFKPLQKSDAINSYADCVAAGNPVLESYPSVCVTKQGKRFDNPDEKLQSTPGSGEAVQSYLTIKEWDVRLPLTNDIKDAYYTLGATGKVYLTTKALQTAQRKITGCTSGLHGLYVERLKPGDKKENAASDPWNEQSLRAANAVKVGNYYYRETGVIEPACIAEGQDEIVTRIRAIQNELRAALQSLQAQ